MTAPSEAARPSRHHLWWVALLVLWGPLYRALMDKAWMAVGGLPLVGQWAQLQSAAELVSAPAMAGVGMGLTVLTAQSPRAQHLPLWLGACVLGALFTAPLLLAALYWPQVLGGWLHLDAAAQHNLAWAATSGWSGLVLGLLSAYWLGQQHQARVLGLTVLTGLPPLIVLGLHTLRPEPADAAQTLQAVLHTGIVLNALALIGLLLALGRWLLGTPRAGLLLGQALRRVAVYLPAGLSIGLLTPLSAMAIRSSLAAQIDWEAAGTATALWRASDWVLSGAAAVLYYHHLPRLSQWAQQGQLREHLPRVLRQVLWPSLALLLLLWALQSAVLPLLYDERLQASPGVTAAVTAAFWAGDLARIAAAVFLYALFALHASKTIAWTEWLSQPLLAALLVLGAGQSLWLAGTAHLGTYVLYAGVNAVAVGWWVWRRPGRGASA